MSFARPIPLGMPVYVTRAIAVSPPGRAQTSASCAPRPQERGHRGLAARAVAADRLDDELQRELADRQVGARTGARHAQRATLDDPRRQHPRLRGRLRRRLERRRDRCDPRADLVDVVALLVPRVDRHEVTLARTAQPQPIDDRRLALAELLDDVRDALAAGDRRAASSRGRARRSCHRRRTASCVM